MVTIRLSSVAPVLGVCFDSGKTSFNAGCCLKVVVTIMKISSTIRMSISEMIMIVGGWRRLRMVNCMAHSFLVVKIKAPQKSVAQRFHLDGQRLHLLVVVAPRDQRRNRDQQAA